MSVRGARRDAIDGLKKAVKQGMPEDVEKDAENEVQKLHDQYLKQIDDLFAAKKRNPDRLIRRWTSVFLPAPDSRVVITVGRQFGSGGREFGLRLATRYGLKYYDTRAVSEAARRPGVARASF